MFRILKTRCNPAGLTPHTPVWSSVIEVVSWAAEEKVPGGVHQGVHDSGGENGSGLAPCPAVKQARNRCENYVTPIGEAHVGDVREAEQHRGGPPAGEFAFGGTRQHILQQSPEQKLLRPRRK